MKEIHKGCEKSLTEAAQKMKLHYDNKHCEFAVELKEGDKVLLSAENFTTTGPSRKLSDKRMGPFVIEKVLSPLNYRLKLPAKLKGIHPVFHITNLRPYKKNTELHPDLHARPPPEIIDGEPEWEIKAVVGARPRGSGFQYLVTYLGYPSEEDQWRPGREIEESAPQLIADFYEQHPNAPRRISAATFHTLPLQKVPPNLTDSSVAP